MNRVREGDLVEILSGEERGARGVVRRVIPERCRKQDQKQDRKRRRKRNLVIVEGLNIVKKHQRPRPTGGRTPVQAGIIEFEAPIHLSNVAPVCPSCDRWTRVGFEQTPDGTKVRMCKRCGAYMD